MSDAAKINYKSALLKSYLEIKALKHRLENNDSEVVEPLAIVGMSCRFPEAPDLESYWRLLCNGESAIREVPVSRWDSNKFYHPVPGVENTTYSKWGGFLSDIDAFDAEFFDISPTEAFLMDPQQRLFLEVAWEAMEDSGYTPAMLSSGKTGVFVGCSNNGYLKLLEPFLSQNDHFVGSGNAIPFIPNRLSYWLNFNGPSLVIDTMCSSSLTALHVACENLRKGECTTAFVGGVNSLVSPEYYVHMSRMRIHSTDGLCKAFDDSADGIVLGEGVGVVVIRTLEEALKNGDRVRAIIRGTAVNHGGASNGITAPNPNAQAAVIESAFRASGINAEQVSYIEAHGTGTSLGDPIEIEGLTMAFEKYTNRKQFCAIGSVKTNIGHLEAAAGISQLIKVVLAMEHGKIPASLHFNTPNRFIPFANTPFQVNAILSDWKTEDTRYAGISSFGLSGTNAHVVIEENKALAPPLTFTRSRHIFTVSAKSESALAALQEAYKTFLEAHPSVPLDALCYTANRCRTHFKYRAAWTAGTVDELKQTLDMGRAVSQATASPRIAFLFTGQGSQFPRMCEDLYRQEPVFRDAIDACAVILGRHSSISLVDALYGAGQSGVSIDHTELTQPMLFSVEYALAMLWASWGIKPDAVMGHSLGEYVAACLAGVFSLEDALRLVAKRGELMEALFGSGKMAVVLSDEKSVQEAIAGFKDVTMAAINGPNNVVISGAAEHVDEILRVLSGRGFFTQVINESFAFHSPLVKRILKAFYAEAKAITFSAPAMRIISNVSGTWADNDMATAEYWCKHSIAPVLFQKSVETLSMDGFTIFLEVGPSPTLVNLGKRIVETRSEWIASVRPGRPSSENILDALSLVYKAGATVVWDEVYRDVLPKVSLPSYPFQRKRYWPELTGTPLQNRLRSGYPLLERRLSGFFGAGGNYVWESRLQDHHLSYFNDHRIQGLAILPFSAYLEMAAEAVNDSIGKKLHHIEDLRLLEALPYRASYMLKATLTVAEDATGDFSVYSKPDARDEAWTLHGMARLKMTN